MNPKEAAIPAFPITFGGGYGSRNSGSSGSGSSRGSFSLDGNDTDHECAASSGSGNNPSRSILSSLDFNMATADAGIEECGASAGACRGGGRFEDANGGQLVAQYMVGDFAYSGSQRG